MGGVGRPSDESKNQMRYRTMRVARPIVGLATILAMLPVSVLAASPSPAAPAPSGSPVAGTGAPSLVGPQWMLVSYVAEDGGQSGASAPASIRFDGSAVSGDTGCNTFQGEYTSTGDSLTMGPLAMTQIACETVAAQEAAIVAGLGETTTYRTDSGDLELLDAQGNARLVYRTLEGHTWVPVFEGDSPVPEAVVTLEFGDGTVSGQGPCNAYSASATVDGSSLTVGPIAASKAACPDLEIEGQLFAALEAARSWSIEAGDLVLLDEAGTPLMSFVAASTGD
jgi:heat shock protein HslJ